MEIQTYEYLVLADLCGECFFALRLIKQVIKENGFQCNIHVSWEISIDMNFNISVLVSYRG